MFHQIWNGRKGEFRLDFKPDFEYCNISGGLGCFLRWNGYYPVFDKSQLHLAWARKQPPNLDPMLWGTP